MEAFSVLHVWYLQQQRNQPRRKGFDETFGRSGQMQCPSGQLLSLERLVFFSVRWGPGCGEKRWQKFVLAHSRGETHRLTHQVIKTWWGNQKPQLTLIASTAATLSHHSFRTYVQQQHWGAGSQLCSQHRGEEVRSAAWRRLLWQVLQKFRDPPSPPFFLLMPSPPSPPRANYFVIRNSDKHAWRFQLPVFHVGRGGGNGTFLSSLSPSPKRSIQRERCRSTLLASIQTISWEDHTWFYSGLPHGGGGGTAHLQTPAGLNGDSCMQRARVQPAGCSGR